MRLLITSSRADFVLNCMNDKSCVNAGEWFHFGCLVESHFRTFVARTFWRPDLLNTELFKCDPELAAENLLPFYCKVWNGEGVPTDWSKGVRHHSNPQERRINGLQQLVGD